MIEDRDAPRGWFGLPGVFPEPNSAAAPDRLPPAPELPQLKAPPAAIVLPPRAGALPKATRITLGIWLVAGAIAITNGTTLVETLTGGLSGLGGGVKLVQIFAVLEVLLAAGLLVRRETARFIFVVITAIFTLLNLAGLAAGDGVGVAPALIINVASLVFFTRPSVAGTFA